MRRKPLIVAFAACVLLLVAWVLWWPRNGELAYLRSFNPHEHDEVVVASDRVFDFEVPYAAMRQRLNARWGKGTEVGDTEIYYKVPEKQGLGRTVWLDAGRFDPNYAETRDPDKACYLTLPRYQPSLMEKFAAWLHRLF